MMYFYALQDSFEQIYYASAEKPDELFQARLKGKVFAIVGKGLEPLECGKALCVHPPQVLNFLNVLEFKLLGELNQCLYNNCSLQLVN